LYDQLHCSWQPNKLGQSEHDPNHGKITLQNIGKYNPCDWELLYFPVIFGYAECFGETWARATDATTGDPDREQSVILLLLLHHIGMKMFIGQLVHSRMFGSGVTPTYLETSWGAYDAPL